MSEALKVWLWIGDSVDKDSSQDRLCGESVEWENCVNGVRRVVFVNL